MPTVKCRCGNTTNSAVSDYWMTVGSKAVANSELEKFEAAHCYAAFDEHSRRWVKGCSFDSADEFMQKTVLDLMGR